MRRLREFFRRQEGGPDLLSTARSFRLPPGRHVEAECVSGYYLDFTGKTTEKDSWPPDWYEPAEHVYVALAQWGLGCFERYLEGEGDRWLQATLDVSDYLLEIQETEGSLAGAWLHPFAMPHTYHLDPPWMSAMSQGECASLLVRSHGETGEERYAEAALAAMGPLRTPVSEGGVATRLGGGYFPEEYPTRPSSYVLNGAIFALWGCRDVGLALDDRPAMELFEEGCGSLAANLYRYDTGYWSRYDLFPHPVMNIASGAYHWLHVDQLAAMGRLASQPEWARTAKRFAAYGESRANSTRAFAMKVAFRIRVPRNRTLEDRPEQDKDTLVLCYHAISDTLPAPLAVTPKAFEQQVATLARLGYRGVTFHEAVRGIGGARRVAFTFDDGYRSVLERAAPILEEYGMPGTVFVPSSHIESGEPMSWPGIEQWAESDHAPEVTPLSWEQLAELAELGWEIGSHTRIHSRLTGLSDEELHEQLWGSKNEIERRLGLPCRTIAYPYGDCDRRVAAAAEACGYEAGAALPARWPTEVDPLLYPRVGIYRKDNLMRAMIKAARPTRALRARPSRLR